MSATTKIWSNGVPPTCEDDDLNGFKSENNNLIVGSGQSLSTSDNEQTHKAVAHYAGVGDFYIDSGVADSYVLSVTGVQVAPPTYANGMRIRFRAGNANTGASTVNVAGLGVRNLIQDSDGAALLPGQISLNETRAYYDGTAFRVTSVSPVITYTTASKIGTGTTIFNSGTSLAYLSENLIALVDNTTDTLRAMEFDGDAWNMVGSTFALVATGGNLALTALNSTDVAYISSTNNLLKTYRFDVTTLSWSQVGSSFSLSVGDPQLAALTSTDVALTDASIGEIRTYRFNGSTWSLVGSGLAVAQGSSAIAALNSTDIAFVDAIGDELRTYRFNGSTWSLVGSGLGLTNNGTGAIIALDSTRVAYIEDTEDTLRLYAFDDSDWTFLRESLPISPCLSPSMVIMNTTDFAYIDATGGQLRLYRLATHSGAGPFRP